jgi:hypothetical protein
MRAIEDIALSNQIEVFESIAWQTQRFCFIFVERIYIYIRMGSFSYIYYIYEKEPILSTTYAIYIAVHLLI